MNECETQFEELAKENKILHDMVKRLTGFGRPFIAGYSDVIDDIGLPDELYVCSRDGSDKKLRVYKLQTQETSNE